MNKTKLLNSLKKQGFSKEILDAFSKVKRENFISKKLKPYAYDDRALSIGEGQTISQPYTIAMMLSLLDLKKDQRVLEIGSGCGYVLALISTITQSNVYGIEIVKELAEKSKINLKEYKNVKVYNKDGALGLNEKAPYDRILISAGCEKFPKKVLLQLKNNGILVAPVGPRIEQSLTVIQRKKNKFIIKEKIPGFIFVPFV